MIWHLHHSCRPLQTASAVSRVASVFATSSHPLSSALLRIGAALAATLLLLSCSTAPQLEADFQRYHQRLGNLLQQDLQHIADTSQQRHQAWLQQLSQWRQQQLTSNSKNTVAAAQHKDLTLGDFYALPACFDTKSLIAEKNTGLGRVRAALSDFVYQHQMVRRLHQCATLSADSEVQAEADTLKIQQLQQQKFADAQHSWNHLLARGNDFIAARYAVTPLIELPLQHHYQSTHSLRLLLDIQASLATPEQFVSIAHFDNAEQYTPLFTSLQQLAQQRTPASVLISLHYLQVQLTTSTATLSPMLTTQACNTPATHTQVVYLSNVFKRFFAHNIQPTASAINQLYYQIQPLLHNLDPVYGNRLQQHFEAYQGAMGQHISMWQALFKRCQITPGQN